MENTEAKSDVIYLLNPTKTETTPYRLDYEETKAVSEDLVNASLQSIDYNACMIFMIMEMRKMKQRLDALESAAAST